MSVVMTVQHGAQATQRFTEQPVAYHLDAAGPDPELKKILPLVFASVDLQISPTSPDDADVFPSIFVEKNDGVKVKESVNSQKVLPIAADNLKGISTYFSRFHPGVDYRAGIGTPILAALPGVVNEVSFERGGYGRYIILVHKVDGQTLFTLYAHMRATTVLPGTVVSAGQKIGEVGLTGHTTGPHLHFEIHDTTRALDPVRFFSGGSLAMRVKN